MKYQKSVDATVQLALFAKRKSEMTDAERVLILGNKLYQKAKQENNRKSQRKSRLYGQRAFGVLVSRHGLIDPTKYHARTQPL